MIFSRKPKTESAVYRKARKRLGTVSADEVLRYGDNLHTHMGQLMVSMRKGLSGRDTPEAHAAVAELYDSAEIMKAVTDVFHQKTLC